MCTEFQILNRAVRASEEIYPDQIVVVFRKLDGGFAYKPEAEFLGDEEQITERYLNGTLLQYA